MAHTLTNYNGVQIVTPEDDLSADRQALNENFKILSTCVQNPMTSNLDAGGFDITDIGTSGDNPALAVNAGAVTSLDGGAITTDGYGDLFIVQAAADSGTPALSLTDPVSGNNISFSPTSSENATYITLNNNLASEDAYIFVDTSGNLKLTPGGGNVIVESNSIGIKNTFTPASSSASGTKGQIAYDSNYLYVCTATNTWKRIALATF